MWNENAPLELLKEMPHVLTEENLSEIQSVIDKDKFINSQLQGADLCGSYAPFCGSCDKSVIYPCAVAYVNTMRGQGMDVAVCGQEEEAAVCEERQQEAANETVASGTKIRIAIARKKKP